MMNKMMRLTWLICFFYFGALANEDLKQFKEKYPKENGVFLSTTEEVEISLDKNGEPVIEALCSEERLFLNDNYKYYMDHQLSFSSFRELEDIKANVFIPQENGKYSQSKVTNMKVEDSHDASIFHDDSKNVVFYYNGLTSGGKTTLSYKEITKEPHFFGRFYFSSYLPVEQAKYVIKTPVDMNIKFTLFGDEKDKVNYTVVTKGKFKIHTWEAKDLGKMEFSDNGVSVPYYATHLVVRIADYKFKGKDKYVLRDVDDLYEYYYDFIKDINKDEGGDLFAITDSITAGIDNMDDKVKTIYYWVQENIRYVAFEDGLGGFIPREASLVCSRRFGDCKDMSSILLRMIRHAGGEAYYTWVGSRSLPYKYSEVPTPAVDNHMICTYFNGEEYVYLDATGSHQPYGVPTAFIQGKEVLIGINETEYKIQTVPVMGVDFSATIDTVTVRFEDGVVYGTGTVYYQGYSSKFLRSHLLRMDETDRDEFHKAAFKKGNNKSTGEVLSLEGIEGRDDTLVYEYKFDIQDYVRENGDDLYFNPFLKKYQSDSKINIETNKIDHENLYKETLVNYTIIQVPEGYKVDYIPENYVYESEKFTYKITLTYDKEKNQIIMHRVFLQNYILLETEQFEEFNKMIKGLNRTYSELIIFKKIK